MDLIEKYGSYDAAKAKQQELSKMAADPRLLFVGNIIKEIGEIEIGLLDYRRQHNIFEVGDKVCYRGVIKQNPFWDLNSIFTIKEIWDDEIDLIASDDDLGCFPVRPHQIGHATDAEIEAGKRLEVNQ